MKTLCVRYGRAVRWGEFRDLHSLGLRIGSMTQPTPPSAHKVFTTITSPSTHHVYNLLWRQIAPIKKLELIWIESLMLILSSCILLLPTCHKCIPKLFCQCVHLLYHQHHINIYGYNLFFSTSLVWKSYWFTFSVTLFSHFRFHSINLSTKIQSLHFATVTALPKLGILYIPFFSQIQFLMSFPENLSTYPTADLPAVFHLKTNPNLLTRHLQGVTNPPLGW